MLVLQPRSFLFWTALIRGLYPSLELLSELLALNLGDLDVVSSVSYS
jgi:hypothetical protein